ncbi:hypothetical protein [Flavobacterium granuli]|uniref:Lipoprotein n=1 Tax=Flavobacterium granuli TaxID=280093 RepID=A0A1M5KB78_9FLAO|nr:hypothetical protein [Flavobacterium granuli]PRZ26224.1 hypothetical protein BC624_102187 [Flavobacterium granuli]SHG49870.1 hypothetical protein SAMN05443373_102187 [Flavobacterium granuli]
MKKIALLVLFVTTLVSCSLDNDNRDTYTYSVLPVDSYTLPENFKLGETYEIKLKYQKPSECHIFQGIYYHKDLNTRTIAVQAAVKDNQTCTDVVPALSETSFNFTVTNTGSYIFKFYKGKDADDKDLFEDVEIQVVQ